MGQKRPDHTSRRLTSFAALDERTTLARPDLAEQALEGLVRAAAFRAVVLDGVLASRGMASWKDYLSAADVEDLRAYANDEARRILQTK